MSKKIKAIIKRPDEVAGHMTYITNTLKNLQKIVGGYIQTVTIGDAQKIVMICNDEGKILELEPNFIYGIIAPDMIMGTVIICGTDGEEFTDTELSMEQWKRLLTIWGNVV